MSRFLIALTLAAASIAATVVTVFASTWPSCC